MTWQPSQHLHEGRYSIEAILGEGGFGITYLALDHEQACRVVIKTLNDEVQADPQFDKFQEDFLNEALRLAKCLHPHVVKVNEIFLVEGLACIVMEYVPGMTLATLVETQGPLPDTEALRYTVQIGEALETVHQRGLLHRDVKPLNIMIRPDRRDAVLIDFGLARDFSPNQRQKHTSYGTDGYAPLEQYDAEHERGAYMDVYALAATLYSMVTGTVPVCAPVRAAGRELDPPQMFNPRLSPSLAEAIIQGMALRAIDRPSSVQDWLKQLAPALLVPTDPQPERLLIAAGAEYNPSGQAVISSPQSPQERSGAGAASTRLKAEDTQISVQQVEALLRARQWQAADEMTSALLLLHSGASPDGGFTLDHVKGCPCSVLRTLDQCWIQASQGHFGMSIQHRLYLKVRRPGVNKGGAAFATQVGWFVEGQWRWAEELTYRLDAPQGHLPLGFFRGSSGGLKSALLLLERAVMAKLDQCHL